jgi:hypothetical protein
MYRKRKYQPKRKNHKKKKQVSKYRPRVPRTLQYATYRPKSAVLKFQKQFVYHVNPGGTGHATNALECVYLTIRANSIYSILQQDGNVNHAGTWTSQNALEYHPGIAHQPNADGYDDWKLRFQHYTVLGSRCQVTYEPLNVPNTDDAVVDSDNAKRESNQAILFLNKVGGSGLVNTTSTMSTISKFPYQKKVAIRAGHTEIGKGGSLSMNYSAKAFEGVTNVMDNTTLKGNLDSGVIAPSQPPERSYFNIGILPTIHALNVHPPPGS